ncbi:hypothetical protein CLOM_g22541 [Closterium sp. NIES-68]|nr:hypothetical protein CLOM_g22541 [Closterium sp. NIES-68]GJP72714.1 hypothetical protein CLOP_g3471 [Closterium sp. NIES-67]
MNAQASLLKPPASSLAAATTGRSGFVRSCLSANTGTAFFKELIPAFQGMRGSRSDSTVPPSSQPWTSWRHTSVTRTLASATPASSTSVPASQVKVGTGSPSPLGPSLVEKRAKPEGYSRDSLPARGTVNFALFSKHATAVTLCLFLSGKQGSPPDLEIALDPSSQRTGDIWHASVENVPLCGMLYAYKVDGPKGWGEGNRFDPSVLLLDPYAPLVDGRRRFGDPSQRMARMYGTFDFESEPFDWGEAEAKREPIPEKDVIIYEMNVRAYTADPSSGIDKGRRGSFSAVADKAQHLVELGVNAVELLPIFEYDEMEFQRRPNPRDHMVNTWGYSTVNFFAPMSRYASNEGGPVAAAREVKEMVKRLHAAGVEVILDVVYNHTNEADDTFPYTTSFRGIDNKTYYIVQPNSYVQLANYAGCGNTLNCNHPVVMQMVLDSLRHWVQEYHVDGFRFDLASVLCRGTDGEPLVAPPLIRAIAKDEVLSKCKLIAEPWDCGGLYQVGSFPNWDRWAEWNGKYRDDVRKFIKGDEGMKGPFATRLAGSADMYHVNQRKPYHSINFVIAHDGFTLRDLVSYNLKHNEANGEEGRDGSNDNYSWNCGAEGPTQDEGIIALRNRQMRNFHLALMLSQGTPMMLMGDEYGHTRNGNNNSYGHDTALNHFLWNQLEQNRSSLFRFTAAVNRLRSWHPALGQANFLSPGDITWHEDNWDNYESRFLAFSLHDVSGMCGDLYVAFNAHSFAVGAGLPPPPPGRQWVRLADTNLPSPRDIVDDLETIATNGRVISGTYNVAPQSTIVLLAAKA